MILPTFIALAGVLTSPPNAAPDTLPLVREAWIMGTRAVVILDRPPTGSRLEASERVLGELRRVERLLSTWDPTSELSKINAASPGLRAMPGAELGELLVRAAELTDRAGGTFDPSVGAYIDAWDLRGSGRQPSPAELERAQAATGQPGVSIDRHSGAVVRHDRSAWLDSGAFGKGAALLAAARLPEADSVDMLVDLGGQLWLSPKGQPRRVEIAHPSDRAATVGHFTLPSGHSVATSGISERAVTIDGVRIGHILDPRTGRPVSGWGSVSVVSDDPMEADALSTALFVMGPEAGAMWAETQGTVAALFVIETATGLRVRWTPPMAQLLPATPDGTPYVLYEPFLPSR